jgi:hypothetical protein
VRGKFEQMDGISDGIIALLCIHYSYQAELVLKYWVKTCSQVTNRGRHGKPPYIIELQTYTNSTQKWYG